MISRREAMTKMGLAASVAALVPRDVDAQAQAPASPQRRDPPSVITNPPRDFAGPVTYPPAQDRLL